jgi:hypothetical protein
MVITALRPVGALVEQVGVRVPVVKVVHDGHGPGGSVVAART